ncbi:hypothetical protein ScPMuIL_002381 [Solemya velum]
MADYYGYWHMEPTTPDASVKSRMNLVIGQMKKKLNIVEEISDSTDEASGDIRDGSFTDITDEASSHMSDDGSFTDTTDGSFTDMNDGSFTDINDGAWTDETSEDAVSDVYDGAIFSSFYSGSKSDGCLEAEVPVPLETENILCELSDREHREVQYVHQIGKETIDGYSLPQSTLYSNFQCVHGSYDGYSEDWKARPRGKERFWRQEWVQEVFVPLPLNGFKLIKSSLTVPMISKGF